MLWCYLLLLLTLALSLQPTWQSCSDSENSTGGESEDTDLSLPDGGEGVTAQEPLSLLFPSVGESLGQPAQRRSAVENTVLSSVDLMTMVTGLPEADMRLSLATEEVVHSSRLLHPHRCFLALILGCQFLALVALSIVFAIIRQIYMRGF